MPTTRSEIYLNEKYFFVKKYVVLKRWKSCQQKKVNNNHYSLLTRFSPILNNINHILARERQICRTKPKILNFCQKYKRASWQFLNWPKDSKNAKKKIFVLHWFQHIFDNLQLVGQICPSLAIYVIIKAWPG